MNQIKLKDFVVLTETIGRACQKVFSGTIAQVSEILDENHVKIELIHNPDFTETRNVNIKRLRLPVDLKERAFFKEEFSKSTPYVRATI